MLRERASVLLLYVHCLSCVDLPIGDLWLKHNRSHRFRINFTVSEVYPIGSLRYLKTQAESAQEWSGCEVGYVQNSKLFQNVKKNCSFVWNYEKEKCIVVKKTYCILCVLDRASSWYLNKGWPTRWHLHYYILLYMFRVSQHPSSGILKTVTATSGTGNNTGTATSLQRGLTSSTIFFHIIS